MSDPNAYFEHPLSLCETNAVGPGTRIWAFAHILSGALIGSDCNICDHVFIENNVVLGDRVTIKSGVQLWDGVKLEDDVFVGPNVTFTNDPFPRSKARPDVFATTLIRRGASLGANSTILPGLTVGIHAMVGAGSVVTRDVPPFAVVVGNPARIAGYEDAGGSSTHVGRSHAPIARSVDAPKDLRVAGVSLLRLKRAEDLRGSLVASDFDEFLPFVPRRFFTVFGVPTKEVRGEHAHRECTQLLVCLAGSVAVVVDNARDREEVVLDDPSVGLLIPPMVWDVQYRYTPDAVLLVLASHRYDPADYIRDYDQFLAEARSQQDTASDIVTGRS